MLKGVLLGGLIGLAPGVLVLFLAFISWRKRLARYRSLDDLEGFRVRYCSGRRFGSWMKFFPWEGVGVLSVLGGKVHFTGIPNKGGGRFQIVVDGWDVGDYGKRSWLSNGLLHWIQLRHAAGDIFVCSETGPTVFGSTKKNQAILRAIAGSKGHLPGPATGGKYQVGQVWNYHARSGEAGSRLYIVRIEPHGKVGMIHHIHVDGLDIRNPLSPSGNQDCLPHAPVSARTLDESVTTMAIGHAWDMPDISEGYAVWREAFDQGEGGVFTIPVAEIIQHIEDIVTGAPASS